MDEITFEQTEKIKFIKLVSGYNWEFTLLGKPEDQLERLDSLVKKLEEKYGKPKERKENK